MIHIFQFKIINIDLFYHLEVNGHHQYAKWLQSFEIRIHNHQNGKEERLN
jgi:hypothetical protein